MKFNLHIVQNGEQKVWQYDNETSLFTDEKGQDPLRQYKKGKTVYPPVKPFTPDHTEYTYQKKIFLLEITLGAKCNFDCVYCSQRTFRDRVYSGSPSDVPHFIELLKQSQVQPEEIQLWGGEPLVYWKTIVVLVPELRKLWPGIKISFPTNGSLLTRDKVDFCKQHNLLFWVSHDGCYNTGREYDGHVDVLKDPVSRDAIEYAMQTLPKGAITFKATFTHNNCNAEKIVHFFKNELGSKALVSLNNVVLCHDAKNPISVESAKLSTEDLDTLQESVFNVCNSREKKDISSYGMVQSLVDSFLNEHPITAIGCECGLPFPNGAIEVDMQGNLLICHNFGPYKNPISIIDLEKYKPLGYTYWTHRDTNCGDCLVIHSCQAACPAIDNEAHKLTCQNSKALHYGYFRAAMASVFGVYLLKAEPIV